MAAIPNWRRATIALALAALGLGGSANAQNPPAGRRVVGLDENGWPIFAGDSEQPRAPTGVPAAGGELPQPVPAGAGQSGAEREPAPVVAQPVTPAAETNDALTALWRSVGSAGDFAALGGVAVQWSLTVLDPDTGQVLGRQHLQHLADVTAARRDRLTRVDERVYRRDGVAVGAEQQGLAMNSLVPVARGELEVFGLLLRAPFCFADGSRFELRGRQLRTMADGPARLELEFAPRGAERALWPRADYLLVCEADSGRPLELRYRLSRSRQRVVEFADWRRIGGVAMPHRLQIVDPRGRPALLLEIESLTADQVLLPSDFRSAP